MRKIIISILLVTLIFSAKAQQWEQLNPKPIMNSGKIQLIDKDSIWITGGPNLVLKSNNGGNEWLLKHPPILTPDKYWRGWFFSGTDGFICSGTNLLQTKDGGKTWVNKEPAGGSIFYSITFLNKDTGWVAADNSTLFRTIDGGQTWTQLTTGIVGETFNNIHFINGNIGFATSGISRKIYKTIDGGITWTSTTFSSVITNRLGKISFLNADTGHVAGSNAIFFTYDGGQTWTPKGSFSGVNDFVFTSKDSGFCNSQDKLYATYNGGNAWTVISQSQEPIVFSKKDNYIVASSNNMLLKSSNNGKKWDTVFVQSSILPSYLEIIESGNSADAKTSWVVGSNGFIAKTSDSARTWTIQNSNTTSQLYCVYPLNKDTIWIGGYAILLKSTNGGTTWNSIGNVSGQIIKDIHFFNKDTGFCVGSTSYIYKTYDGGITWTTATNNASGVLNDLCFVNRDTGYACGELSSFLRTTNKGVTWSQQSLPDATISNITKIDFKGSFGMLTTTNAVYATKNSGNTWTRISVPDLLFTDIKMLSTSVAVASNTTTGNLYKSTDHGNTWHEMGSPALTYSNDAYNFIYADSNYIIAAKRKSIISGNGKWLLSPILDSISVDSFYSTDTLDITIYGKNFNNYSKVIFDPHSYAKIKTTLVTDKVLRVIISSNANFYNKYYNISVQNRGESAGSTAIKTLKVYDSIPGIPASKIFFSNRDSTKFNMSWLNGSGTKRIVIARKNSPVNSFPQADSSPYVSGNFGLGSHLGNGNYVVYNGSGSSINLTSLEPNATYYFVIIEYSSSNAPFNYSLNNYASASCRTSNVFYNRPTGVLNKIQSWNTKPDGSGLPPINFMDSFTYYYPNYNINPIIDSSWTVTGNKSIVIFGNGTSTLNFNISSGANVYMDSIIVKSKVTITCNGDINFRKSNFATNTLLNLNSSVAQSFPAAAYYNVSVSGGEKTLTGNASITKVLNMSSNINCNGNSISLTSSLASALTYTSGTIKGILSKTFNTGANLTAHEMFPIGRGARHCPVNINFPSVGSAITVTAEFIDSATSYAGLPVNDATPSVVNINKIANEGFWRINVSNSRTYSLAIAGSGFLGVADSSKLRIVKRLSGSNWTLQGTHQAITGTKTTPVVSRSGLSGSGEFAIGSDSSLNALPVKLINFTGSRSSEGNILSWTTSSEINNKGFYVYRSLDLNKWSNIAFIKGAGTINFTKNYSFLDEVNSDETWYYFLKQTDFSGAFENSKIVTIHRTDGIKVNENEIVVFPNPVSNGNLFINLIESLPTTLSIYNTQGIKQSTHYINSKQELDAGINIKHLSPGLYYLMTNDIRGVSRYKFIIK